VPTAQCVACDTLVSSRMGCAQEAQTWVSAAMDAFEQDRRAISHGLNRHTVGELDGFESGIRATPAKTIETHRAASLPLFSGVTSHAHPVSFVVSQKCANCTSKIHVLDMNSR